jgi:hypothetical protein
MDIKGRNPKMNNIYPEVGSLGALAIADPIMAMHGMGKNIKTYGVDHDLGNGLPLVGLTAVGHRRLQALSNLGRGASSSATKITKEDTENLRLNAAKIYNMDVKAK